MTGASDAFYPGARAWPPRLCPHQSRRPPACLPAQGGSGAGGPSLGGEAAGGGAAGGYPRDDAPPRRRAVAGAVPDQPSGQPVLPAVAAGDGEPAREVSRPPDC